jgi:hypothetical protein
MTTTLRPLVALAMLALIGAGCAGAPTGTTGDGGDRDRAVKFAECMRGNGVTAFPDPDASGQLTVDGVANGSSVDAGSETFARAMDACRDLQPSGFTGRTRNAQQQADALRFARCIRENGVKDFPDPTPDSPLVDTNRIPSAASGDLTVLNAAMQACRDAAGSALGGR